MSLQALKDQLNRSKQAFSKIAASAKNAAIKFDQNPVVKTINTVGGIPAKSTEFILNQAKDFVRGKARLGAGAVLDATGGGNYVPSTGIEKLVFGPDVIKPISRRIEETTQTAERYGISRSIGKPGIIAVGGILEALDFTTGGGGGTFKKLGKESLEFLVSKYGDDAVKKLLTGKGGKKIIKEAMTLLKKDKSVAEKIVKGTKGVLNKDEAIKYGEASARELNEDIAAIPGKEVLGEPLMNPKPAAMVAREEYEQATKKSLDDLVTDITTPSNKSHIYDINSERMSVNTVGKEQLENAKNTISSELETIYGRPITQDEVVNAAKHQKVLKTIVPRDQVLEEAAAIRRTEEAFVNLANEVGKVGTEAVDSAATVTMFQELLESYKVVKSLARRDAVLLGSRRGMVEGLPENIKIVDEILDKIKATDKQIDLILKEGSKIDPYNTKQLAEFFRKYVKPSKMDVINEWRYINLLSSPKTHIVNAASNLLQVVLRPFDKMASGAVDGLMSAFTGKQRNTYIREVPEYVRGALNSIGTAWKEARHTFSGGVVERPDLVRIPTGVVPKAFTSVTRAMEAADIFFRKIISSGEYESLVYRELRKAGGKEILPDTLNLLRKQADDVATKYVFREELGAASQGHFFKAIDGLAGQIKKIGEKFPPFKFIVPFVDTPTNILKQGIERTPIIGLAAMPGSKEKMEIIGRQLVGSTLFMGAGYLALQDRTTWRAPTNPSAAAEFYASGKQPYSIKVGDSWVSYDRLGPAAYPLAFAAALKQTFVDEQEAIEEKGGDPRSFADNTTRAILKMTRFFGDQSYMENIGNLMDAVFDEDIRKLNRLIANIPAQLIPLSGLISTITHMVDDTYRKPDSILDNLKSQLPGLSFSVDSYKDPIGEASKRYNRFFNLLSPVSITKERAVIKPGTKPTPKVSPKPTPKPKPSL